MPSHPDRVRRHYDPAPVILVDRPEHCTACDRYHLPPVGPECPYDAITDNGFTANVIEGEHDDDRWGV